MKQKTAIFFLIMTMLIPISANAAWHLVNGRYIWLSVDCEAFSKGGGATDSGRVVCALDKADYLTFCANPQGFLVGEGVPSQPIGDVVDYQLLDDSTILGNGKIFSNIELDIAPEYGDTAAIEALLGDQLCDAQKQFYPVLAILRWFESTLAIEECSSKNVVDGECIGGIWKTKSTKTFACSVPEEFTFVDTYPPPEGTQLECDEVP